jgi:hypothetical protein
MPLEQLLGLRHAELVCRSAHGGNYTFGKVVRRR